MLVWPRLILAHHYPSDLIVGAAVGVAAVAAASATFLAVF
jgi:membrane-associated phospholipid phosphatase